MRVAFDTNVLVAGTLTVHPGHAEAAAWLTAARTRRIDGFACRHATAEFWATVTALPLTPRVTPATAQRLLGGLGEVLSWEDPIGDDYETAVRWCRQDGVQSGGIYDALHLAVANRCGAALLVTPNLRHFLRFQGRVTPVITSTSAEPPAVA